MLELLRPLQLAKPLRGRHNTRNRAWAVCAGREVRDAAAGSACALLSSAAPELFHVQLEGSSGLQPAESSNFARHLIRHFARGKCFRSRMMYIRMCDSVIREAPLHVFTAPWSLNGNFILKVKGFWSRNREQSEEFFMRPLLWLSLDPVKNVRLCWARRLKATRFLTAKRPR